MPESYSALRYCPAYALQQPYSSLLKRVFPRRWSSIEISPFYFFLPSSLARGGFERSARLTTHASPPNANSRETPFHTPPTPSYELESCAHPNTDGRATRVKVAFICQQLYFRLQYLQCIEGRLAHVPPRVTTLAPLLVGSTALHVLWLRWLTGFIN